MQKFGVYRIVHRSEAQGRRLLTSKWVHKRKTNKFGEISRYKGRLVARGFAQLPYENFNPDETFAHVVDRNSLRALLALSAGRNLKVYSMDVVREDLYGGATWRQYSAGSLFCTR